MHPIFRCCAFLQPNSFLNPQNLSLFLDGRPSACRSFSSNSYQKYHALDFLTRTNKYVIHFIIQHQHYQSFYSQKRDMYIFQAGSNFNRLLPYLYMYVAIMKSLLSRHIQFLNQIIIDIVVETMKFTSIYAYLFKDVDEGGICIDMQIPIKYIQIVFQQCLNKNLYSISPYFAFHSV